MALDEPKDNDEVVKQDGVTFLVNKDLLEETKPITVDYVDGPKGSGFKLESSLSAGKTCGSCSC